MKSVAKFLSCMGCIYYDQNKFDEALRYFNKAYVITKDIKDGFIHLSDREQVNQTLKKYFSNQKDLVLLILKTDTLNNLIWEKSTNDEKFPHLYSKLQIENVLDNKEIIGDQYLF